jgi:hypothetical protein
MSAKRRGERGDRTREIDDDFLDIDLNLSMPKQGHDGGVGEGHVRIKEGQIIP